MKLGELAKRLGAELRGDAELEVTGVKGIEEAGPTEITFVANPKYAGLARTTKAAAVLVEPEFPEIKAATLRIKNPYHAFSRTLGFFYQPPAYAPGIHATAVIDPTAIIGEGAHIGAYVVIGPRVRLGDHATLLPHVVLYPGVQAGSHFFAHAHAVVRENCILGDHVTLENGAIIGADGFGYVPVGDSVQKVPQVGIVEIEDDVEIGANTTIDRAKTGVTSIGARTKIDNLVQIAHNVVIGEYSIIVAQVGISGSAQLGKGVIIGGQAGLVGHIRIGDHAMVAAGSGVTKDIAPGQVVAGTPHRPHREWLKMEACLSNLPEMRETLAALQRRLEAIEKKTEKKEPL